MHLIQIKLAGFKSFVDNTVIPIPSQLVGIVGPNGCGKSNIIDAVRWVLGESRASELRGESMQDVIFNGSDQRKPAGRASVELVFDNSEGRAVGQWQPFAEISVRRTLTRDGKSSYFINNQVVRRRDIHDLFLGTGLGSRGYAIIGQGMINRLIEAKPEELRNYLEEAAGVSRYKERRRETENRLHDTRENLTRVEDILSELTSQLNRLQKQAEVATRYRQLRDEGEQKQHALWYLKEQEAQAQQTAHKRARDQAQLELDEALSQMRQLEKNIELRRQHFQAASRDLQQEQAVFYDLNTQVASVEATIRHAHESKQRLSLNQSRLQQQIDEWQAQVEHADDLHVEVSEALAIATATFDECQVAQEQAQARLPALEQVATEANLRRDTLRQALSRSQQQQALAQQQQQDVVRQQQGLQQRGERIAQEQAQLSRPAPDELEQLQGEQNNAARLLEEAQHRVNELEEAMPDLEACRQERGAMADEAQQRLTRLEARLQALESLQAEVMRDEALTPWLSHLGLDEVAPLWQRVQIEAGWETALEAVLRERLSALEVAGLEQHASGADNVPGRVALYELPTDDINSTATGNATASGNAAASGESSDSSLRPLIDLIRCPDPELKDVLRHWLAPYYIADDLAQAMAQRSDLPVGAFFVVPQGHVIDAVGVCFYAPDNAQAGILARQQAIDSLVLEVRAQQLIVDEAQVQVQQAQAQWQANSEALVPARQRVVELTRYLHEKQLAYRQLDQQQSQATYLHERLSNEAQEVTFQLEELAAQIEETALSLATLQDELLTQEEDVAEATVAVEQAQAELAEQRQVAQDAERAWREADYEQRSLRHRLDELRRTREVALQQSTQAQLQLEGLSAELFELDESQVQQQLQALLENRAAQEEKLNALRQELEGIEQRLREHDEARLRLEMTLEPKRQAITEQQLQEQAARLQAEQYAEQLQAHEVDRDALPALIATFTQAQQVPEEQHLSWLQDEMKRISQQIERLGAVNLAALEELSQATERKTFLDAQQQDLLEAINTLEQAIREIDRETRQLLQQTFDTVNGHFGELFPRLFGGGQARLVMTGEEILDAGVQVMAQPPGKRNTTIHLLSGGEKALTATALVFALFKLNPAPFCLLDEVDAPLDDANTERYAKLVESMSDQTQFLFISHNKIAMHMAQQLIGVTMQEQGVSRIVAVDIDAAVAMAS